MYEGKHIAITLYLELYLNWIEPICVKGENQLLIMSSFKGFTSLIYNQGKQLSNVRLNKIHPRISSLTYTFRLRTWLLLFVFSLYTLLSDMKLGWLTTKHNCYLILNVNFWNCIIIFHVFPAFRWSILSLFTQKFSPLTYFCYHSVLFCSVFNTFCYIVFQIFFESKAHIKRFVDYHFMLTHQ